MENTEKKIRNKKRQNIIAVLILVFGIAGSFLVFWPKNQKLEIEEEKTPALVEITTVSKEQKKISLRKVAIFSAGDETAEARADFSGRISEVKFSVGDYVSAGQILAVFDQSRLENSPKISFESAQNSFKIAQENFFITKNLTQKGVDIAQRNLEVVELREKQVKENSLSSDEDKKIAKENVKIAKEQIEQAKNSAEAQKNGANLQVEQARLMLSQAEASYAKTFIKAPISGTIVSKNVNEQELLNFGTQVAEIVGKGKIETAVFLSREEIDRIKLQDQVEIELDGQKYSAKIDSFSKIANKDNQRFEVRIVSTEDISPKANQSGEVILNLYLDSSEQAFFAPLEAVIIGQRKKEIFVFENGKAFSREVEIGKIFDTQVEILSGLSLGEKIIVKNSRNLQNEQAVRTN